MNEGSERALSPISFRNGAGRAYGTFHAAIGLTALPASVIFGSSGTVRRADRVPDGRGGRAPRRGRAVGDVARNPDGHRRRECPVKKALKRRKRKRKPRNATAGAHSPPKKGEKRHDDRTKYERPREKERLRKEIDH